MEIPLYSLFPSLLTREEFQRIRLTFGADFTMFRFFYYNDYQTMSSNWVVIPAQHFELGLQLPIDPFLADILLLLEIQSAHLHPKSVRTGVEPSIYIFSLFFYPIKMVPNVVSFRPWWVLAQLFDSPSSKVDWRDKWVMVESSVGFPFKLKVNNFKIKNWPKPGKEPNPTTAERALLEVVEKELGSSLKGQRRVFSTWLLLEEESLSWAGIGSSEERRKELGMDDDEEFPYWVLHPGDGAAESRLKDMELEVARLRASNKELLGLKEKAESELEKMSSPNHWQLVIKEFQGSANYDAAVAQQPTIFLEQG